MSRQKHFLSLNSNLTIFYSINMIYPHQSHTKQEFLFMKELFFEVKLCNLTPVGGETTKSLKWDHVTYQMIDNLPLISSYRI